MLQKNTKIAASIGGVFFLVSITICGVFFHMVLSQRTLFHERGIEYAQAESYQNSLRALTQMLSDTVDERMSLISRILKEADVINLLALIESLGKEQGANLVTNSLTIQPINDVFETLVINVTVEGSYASVMSVLKLIEHLPYQVSIGNVQFGKDGGGERTWKSSYEVRVTKFKNHEL